MVIIGIQSLALNKRIHYNVYIGQTADNCIEDSIRVVNGSNNGSGQVEVCRFGCWGTVCDEGWDRDDANIACRQLRFQETAAS